MRTHATMWMPCAVLAAALAPRVEPLPARLVPVPLHRNRLRRRGYNQAVELARPLGRALGLPVAPRLCRRQRPTPAQAELTGSDRRRNVRGAFAVAAPVPRHVAIVDDVVTTGSTVGELARVLRRAGAERVEVWAVARA